MKLFEILSTTIQKQFEDVISNIKSLLVIPANSSFVFPLIEIVKIPFTDKQ
jgi:hypothetical protein